LQGQKEMRPRWWRCTKKVDGLLGEALGQAFVKTAFAGDSKKRTLDLIANLEKALKKDIETELPWMTQETKKQAIVKLAAVAQKIGYPDKWRDYSKLNIVRGDFFGNTNRANAFEIHRQLAKIGQPVDKTEWGMSPPTVNAYYNPQMNDINFPAGILQPPFFHKDWDDALNYGAIGVVIGHEITHGFDDEGRQFDPQGNLRDWWSKDDAKAFNERAQCIVDEYGSFVAVRDAKNGDVKQDGKLTLGENAADNGGIHIAWNALRDYTNVKDAAPIDGLSPSQRFFLSFAQIWCGVQTDDSALTRAKTDPHSAGKFRVNGTVSNMPEFQTAFSCKTGQPMAPEKRCRIW
jgi:putative endopeptidase